MIRAQERGMTLLELLVAMAVFTLVAAACYTGLDWGLAAEERLQLRRERWTGLESMFSLIERDLDQASDRRPRTPIGRIPSFRGHEHHEQAVQGELFTFTRGGHLSVFDGPASPYLQIAYRLQDGRIYRTAWSRLDRPIEAGGDSVPISENIAGVRLRYLARDRRWHSNWPAPGDRDSSGLPAALELTIEAGDDISYRRLFHVGPPR